MKIIVVDDNKIFREGIKYYLENILNYEVIGMATNGEEFLEMSNKQRADIILMDIEMPVMNGIEAAKKALWQHNDLNIIAVTNYQHKTYLKELICAGFKSCIFKDKIYDAFEDTVSKVLGHNLNFPDKINLD